MTLSNCIHFGSRYLPQTVLSYVKFTMIAKSDHCIFLMLDELTIFCGPTTQQDCFQNGHVSYRYHLSVSLQLHYVYTFFWGTLIIANQSLTARSLCLPQHYLRLYIVAR